MNANFKQKMTREDDGHSDPARRAHPPPQEATTAGGTPGSRLCFV